ncbi:type IV secretion system DNA-binding domain-containing protein [Actinomadura sp. B10D3]|uniref:type IV secretory system conjugative DNA transfer family protein n=1 Tax=Actinomadura sp. B10D3 TaxID=3153557 RepID=UPI00325D370A
MNERLASSGWDWTDLVNAPEVLASLLTDNAVAITAGMIAAAAVVLGYREVVWHWRHARHQRAARIIMVSVPPVVDRHSAEAWWSHQVGLLAPLWKRWTVGQPHLAFEYVADASGIRIQVWVPGTVPPGMIEKTIRAAWPGATLSTTEAAAAIPTREATGGRLVTARADHFPLRIDYDSDPLRPLLGAAAGLRRGEHAIVQVLARPVTGLRLKRAYQAAAALRRGHSTAPQGTLFDLVTPGKTGRPRNLDTTRTHPERTGQIRAILTKAAQPRFEVQVRYAVATDARSDPSAFGWLRGQAHALASTFAIYGSGQQYLRRKRLHHPLQRIASRKLRRGHLFSVPELAALAHLPMDADAPGITRAGARPVAPSPAVPADGEVRVLGDADAGHPRPVALPITGARQHVHVLGQTGVGKSTLLASMILSDAHAGRGALVIDPKGDLVIDVLDRLPYPMVERTVLFDPTDSGPPPSVNVLAGPDPHFAVDSTVTIFHRCFSSAWGPRLDDLLRSACLTLIGVNGSRATLTQIPKLLTDSAYRARIVSQLADELLTGFWNGYDDLSPGARATVIGPVMNKLRAVLLRPFVRDALSATESTVDLGRHLDAGGLVLARLPKGVLGEDATRLFGSMLLAHTWQGVTRRAAQPEDRRPDSAAYVDECHNFLNLPGSVSDILAEARGYRLSLVLAHQHLTQLPRDLRDAVSADARNKIYFTTSPEDAGELARHVAPLLSVHDLAHLGAFQAAGRLITGSEPSRAFTFRTRPLSAVVNGRQQATRRVSRSQYGATRPVDRKRPPRPRTAPADPRTRRGRGDS